MTEPFRDDVRNMLWMRHVEKWSFLQIAERFGSTVEHIKAWHARNRMWFKDDVLSDREWESERFERPLRHLDEDCFREIMERRPGE